MCRAIYIALFLLLLYYSDSVIDQFALSIGDPEQEWMVIAIGWEILQPLWPLGLLLMVVASALTLVVLRMLNRS